MTVKRVDEIPEDYNPDVSAVEVVVAIIAVLLGAAFAAAWIITW